MQVMEATPRNAQPRTRVNSKSFTIELADSSSERDLVEVRRYIGLVEQLHTVDAATRSSVTEHRWNNLLNNAFLTLDCLEAMISSGRQREATRMLPIAIRSLTELGL